MPMWIRTASMDRHRGSGEEVWTARDNEHGQERDYTVQVRIGKSIDILALKLNVMSAFDAQVSEIRDSRRSVYESVDTECLEHCPICRSSTSTSEFQLSVYGGRYHQCADCSHCFIINPCRQAHLDAFYASNTHFASTYTDPRITETRVQQVARPKAEWLVEQFSRRYGRAPRQVLDVGAGGGHFVHACRQLGLEADGLELSEASRAFCKTTFGFELQAIDVTRERLVGTAPEVVTFWNVLEHVSDPMRMLAAVRRILPAPEAMVIVEVPRWNCLTTGVQRGFPETVVRHLDPLAHINFFTDSSLATAFEASGFAPAAAWYFGMDAYELILQLSYCTSSNGQLVIESLGRHIPVLQQAVDLQRGSDAIVLAGTAIESS